MFNEKIRQTLKTACRLYGNQKAVAIAANVDSSNFGKWLKGAATLSPENINSILQVLGLPDLKPETNNVLIWHVTSPPKGLISNLDLIQVLELYFPNGGEIAKAPWAFSGANNLKRMLITPWKQPMATYAITDGQVRAILRLSVPMLLQKVNIKSFLKWRDGSEDMSILNIADTEELWINGTPTLEEFDEIWNDKGSSKNAGDLILAVRKEGITFEEAIRRIGDST